MLRPRDALAQLRARTIPTPLVLRDDRWPSDAGAGRTIALIDGVPDLRAAALARADIEVQRIGAGLDAPPDEHATHGASLLVDRELGVVPGARLLAAGVTAADGTIAPEAVAAAIDWAARERADVIVIPLGDHHDHAEVTAAIRLARARGVVVVAAAGNAHPRPLLFPARLPGVLAVGACDPSGALLEDCCRRPRLDLVVPARDVVAAVAPERLAPRSGTSVAAVLAGGLITLALSQPAPTPRLAAAQQEKP